MEPFRKILFGLDGTDKDNIILQNFSLMSKFMDIQKIFFIHIPSISFLPRFVKNQFPEIEDQTDSNQRDQFYKKIETSFTEINKYDHDLVFQPGERSEVMIKFIVNNDIDFLVLGRKTSPGITYFSKKMGHLAPCSIGFFPNVVTEAFKRIVVPVDFSPISIEALSRAYFYKGNNPDLEVLPVHFYYVHPGFYKIGKTFDEFSDIMKENANKQFELMFSKIQDKPKYPDFDIVLDKHENLTKKIFEYTLSKSADLLLIGSRGRNKFASFMLGSVAVRLVDLLYHIPIIIEKDKAQSMGLIDAILEI